MGMSNLSAVTTYLARQAAYVARRAWLRRFLRGLIVTLARNAGVVRGLEHIPAEGGAILMMNHTAAPDPAICTAFIEARYIITMAKVETLRNPFVALFNALWGNFVVKRGQIDRFALLSAIELVKQGQIVLIAPEGTRHADGLRDPKDGIAYIAHKADALIIPAAVVVERGWFMKILTFRRVHWELHIGQPFRFRQAGKLTQDLRQQMMHEALYHLARYIPAEYAHLRGDYADLRQATTHTLEFP
jgi:1-acyl-sn-glycerol-3-phosphate acyltransferase